jgi:hypothetical protein
LADEVIVILVYSEIVNCLLAGEGGGGGDHAPFAADGFQAIAYAHFSGWRPLGFRVAALDREGVAGAWVERVAFALDAHLEEFVVVRGGERCYGLGFQLAGGAVAGHDLVADCDLLDGRVAVVGVDGRAGGEGICGCVARASVSVIRSDVPQTQQFLLASASAGLL